MPNQFFCWNGDIQELEPILLEAASGTTKKRESQLWKTKTENKTVLVPRPVNFFSFNEHTRNRHKYILAIEAGTDTHVLVESNLRVGFVYSIHYYDVRKVRIPKLILHVPKVKSIIFLVQHFFFFYPLQ